jgi:hypothetical protein
MPQLSIQNDPAPSFSGQRAYPMKRWIDTSTRFVDQTVRLPAATAEISTANVELGFAVRQEFTEQNGVGYADGEPITVMQVGYMWCEVEGTVVSGAPVFVRHAAGAGGAAAFVGRVRGDADGGTATALPNARFDTGTISGLAIVRLGD